VKVVQLKWSNSSGWVHTSSGAPHSGRSLVFLFASRGALENSLLVPELQEIFPHGTLVGCSTSGEIAGIEVSDDSAVATSIQFESTPFVTVSELSDGRTDSQDIASSLMRQLPSSDLRHVFLFAPGISVNGSELSKGANTVLPAGVSVTGGLAGDGALFSKTLTVSNRGVFQDQYVAVGLYGNAIQIGHGSIGGWDLFGPSRIVTKSRGNVLYELNGKSALGIYKTYLGAHAEQLPSSGLLFPLAVKCCQDSHPLVRTILAVDEDEQSITFAGDIPEGAIAQMMQANFNRLIQGASDAASAAQLKEGAEFALLISCVGRKLVLKQRTEEEVEMVHEILGKTPVLTGFYSYGEISPIIKGGPCELHNQTMTITTLKEQVK
jgi:hypothetical protein